MTSTGNDIIALKSINLQRTKQKRFYSKILSFSELELYYSEEFSEMHFENYVWLLWSVKESVYKYLKRSISGLIFSPTKIIIEGINVPRNCTVTKFGIAEYERASFCEEEFYNCIVHFGSEFLYSRSKIHNELIHTVVSTEEVFENIWWGIKHIEHSDYENQSKEVRSFVLNKLSSIFPNNNLQIAKSEIGYPVLLKETKEMDIPISFAHHDHFIAYSLLLRNIS